MLKRFCDMCSVEMEGAVRGVPAVGGLFKRNGVEIHVAVTVETHPKGEIDVCGNCVIDAVASLDARPKADVHTADTTARLSKEI